MPRDFKSFAKEHENIMKEHKEETNKYEEMLNKYKNMNSNELMSNLFEQAGKLKQEGKLDSNTLNNLKTTLSPFLNNEQKNMLEGILKAIDEQK